MQTQKSVKSIKEANELFKELSSTMECGERVKVMIKNVGEIQKYVEIIIKYGLSLIDIEEVNNDYYLVIENRFGVRCV
ncbi:MAG: hypothetical protein QN229_03665 [Desulfurococcaceae archaeon TW002]